VISRRFVGDTLVLVGADARRLGLEARSVRRAEPDRRVLVFVGATDAPELEAMISELTGTRAETPAS
jgi:hypothetical protein